MARRFLRHEPGAFEICVQDHIPIRLRLIENRLPDRGAGIVDEDRDGPKLGLRRLDGPAHIGGISHVEHDRQRPAVDRCDLAGDLQELIELSTRQCDTGAGAGQCEREMPAEAATGPGDDGGLARQIELQHYRSRKR